MKTKILLLAIIAPLFTFSQDMEVIVKDKLGFKAEIGASKVYEIRENLSNNNFKQVWGPSFSFGLFYERFLSGKSFLSAELKYNHLTSTTVIEDVLFADISGEIKYADIPYDFRFSYFSVPVYYTYKIGRFSPNIGFNLSLLLSDRLTVTAPPFAGLPENVQHEAINSDQIDYGARIGLGYDISRRVSIDATYYHGLNDIIDWDTNGELEWYNRQVMVGVKFWLEGI